MNLNNVCEQCRNSIKQESGTIRNKYVIYKKCGSEYMYVSHHATLSLAMGAMEFGERYSVLDVKNIYLLENLQLSDYVIVRTY